MEMRVEVLHEVAKRVDHHDSANLAVRKSKRLLHEVDEAIRCDTTQISQEISESGFLTISLGLNPFVASM